MKAIATKQSSNNTFNRTSFKVHPNPIPEVKSLSPFSISHTVIQRKPNCSCGGGCPRCKDNLPIQTKLKINEPGDVYEQEADRIADQIMRMADEEVLSPSRTETKIQRKCAECSSGKSLCPECAEEEIQRKAISETITPLIQRQPEELDEEEREELLQTKEVPGGTPESITNLENHINSISGCGQHLPESIRAFFESRFRHDFSRVRVHIDSKAAKSAQEVNALAYTTGQDIVFGAGQYMPETYTGMKLLAHELAHVLHQQSFSQTSNNTKHSPEKRFSRLTASRTQQNRISTNRALASLANGLSIIIQRQQRNICTLPRPGSLPSLPTLSPDELQRRRRAIQEAINRARSTYPLATTNLQHWLDSAGRVRIINLSEFNFASSDSGVPLHLLNVHRRQVANGITRRLRSTDPQSLQPPGVERAITWQDSIRASPIQRTGTQTTPSPQLERDLSIALGGFIVKSQVRVRARTPVTNRQEIEVLSWRVQICDRYDWIVGAAAPIFIPPTVPLPPIPQGAGTVRTAFGMQVVFFNDEWMAQVEQSGGGRAYNIFSEIFEAPDHVKQNFIAINGRVA